MHFDLTHTDIDGEKCGFRPKQSLAQVKNSMPKLFPGAAARQNNIIVRPLSKTVHFVQLDDLNAAGLGRVCDSFIMSNGKFVQYCTFEQPWRCRFSDSNESITPV